MRLLITSLMLAAALAGCADGDINAPGEDPDDVAGLVVLTTFEGNTGYSAQTPARAFNNGGAFSQPLEFNQSVDGFVFELTWDANTQNEDQLDLWVRDSRAGTIPPEGADEFQTEPVATATGASPLRLVVPADDLDPDAAYEVLVRAQGPVGVADNQDFTLVTAVFIGIAVNPDIDLSSA